MCVIDVFWVAPFQFVSVHRRLLHFALTRCTNLSRGVGRRRVQKTLARSGAQRAADRRRTFGALQ